jgi:hypothetical protein
MKFGRGDCSTRLADINTEHKKYEDERKHDTIEE